MIEWTEKTWNPVVGCTPVSSGCLNCYAATMATRLHGMTLAGRSVPGYESPPLTELRNGRSVFNGTVRCLESKLGEPLKWRKSPMVFVNSMSDLFHEAVPFEFIDRVFAVMALCPHLTFQVLTKRPERMRQYLVSHRVRRRIEDAAMSILREHDRAGVIDRAAWPLPNVWLGVSVEDQAAADERIPALLACPAAVWFLSVEPLIGPVDLWGQLNGIGWVIVGGESGPKARRCNVGWIRSVVKQCRHAGVPVFVKQLGQHVVVRNDSFSEWPDDGDGLLYDAEGPGWSYQGESVRVRLRSRKGADPAEWPEDLRVREFPAGEPVDDGQDARPTRTG